MNVTSIFITKTPNRSGPLKFECYSEELILMHAKASFVFWLTLLLYLITLFSVSYVGVYLTYIAIPILIISGIIMKCSTPKPEHKKVVEDGKSALRQVGHATNDVLEGVNEFLEGVNEFLEDFNISLSKYNEVNKMVRERTSAYRNKIKSLIIEKVPLETSLKYSKPHTEKVDLENKINHINKEIEINEKYIEQITQACELEVNAP